ncbi:MAG: TlpA family protein disulfide reductase [Oscillospiraceae bacterium]|nr:TlpA family protein disulfide reductase [Oscillospiraceae bacterium]
MKRKTIISFIAMASLIVCATVAYNILSAQVGPVVDLNVAAGYTAPAGATTGAAAVTGAAEADASAADAAVADAAVADAATADAAVTGAAATDAAAADAAATHKASTGHASAAESADSVETTATNIEITDTSTTSTNNAETTEIATTTTTATAERDDDMQEAPDFAMVDWDGNNVTLHELIANGKPIVLNFWASWCPPCKGEMPEFELAYQELGDSVQFIMLDITDGQRETRDIGAKFINDEGYTFPVFFDEGQEGAYTYGIRYIPTTIFIDRDGYIVAGSQSAIDGNLLRRGIDLIQ